MEKGSKIGTNGKINQKHEGLDSDWVWVLKTISARLANKSNIDWKCDVDFTLHYN